MIPNFRIQNAPAASAAKAGVVANRVGKEPECCVDDIPPSAPGTSPQINFGVGTEPGVPSIDGGGAPGPAMGGY